MFKCDYCGRFGHLAKYCFDLKRKSHLTNASNRPHVFKCDVCGRFGHLAKFCFDMQKASKLQYVPNRPLFKNISHLQNIFKVEFKDEMHLFIRFKSLFLGTYAFLLEVEHK